MENKIAKSYYTKTHSSGIIECILNTYEKWIEYTGIGYRKDLNKLEICCWDYDNEKYINEYFDLEIDRKMIYAKTITQEKDEFVIYFIPYNLIGKEQWLKE
jgi:hypothetical protein